MNTKTGSRKTYNADFVEKLKAKLNEAPEVKKVRELTASEAVKEMAKEIHAMQKKGYTLAMILEMLKANDVNVSLATLKSSIAGTKAKKESKSKTKPVQHPVPEETNTSVASVSVTQTAIFEKDIEPDNSI